MMADNVIMLRPTDRVGDVKTARSLFRFFEDFVAKGLPTQLKPEVLINAVINSCQKTPKLLECTQESMLSALMHCGSVGWVPDTPAQECHLIPFAGKVQVIGGYRGFIKLVRNSGKICNIATRVVYRGDEFSYELGLTPKMVHIPKLIPEDRPDEDITYVYSITWWTDPAVFPREDFEVMSKAQVDKIMAGVTKKNRGNTPDPWKYHYAEQARKTVLKRQIKRLPQSAELAVAVELDNMAVTVEHQPLHQIVQDMVDAEKPTTAENLTEKMKAKAEATGEQPRVWSTDDLERLWKERGMGLSIERRSVVEGDMSSGDCLPYDYIAELCEELSALEPQ